jgi:hypothetical protein
VDASTYQFTVGTEVLTAKNKSTLVFHKYGDQYFLEQIWLAGERQGTQLLESRIERNIRMQSAQTQQSNMSGQATNVETINIVASLR